MAIIQSKASDWKSTNIFYYHSLNHIFMKKFIITFFILSIPVLGADYAISVSDSRKEFLDFINFDRDSSKFKDVCFSTCCWTLLIVPWILFTVSNLMPLICNFLSFHIRCGRESEEKNNGLHSIYNMLADLCHFDDGSYKKYFISYPMGRKPWHRRRVDWGAVFKTGDWPETYF